MRKMRIMYLKLKKNPFFKKILVITGKGEKKSIQIYNKLKDKKKI